MANKPLYIGFSTFNYQKTKNFTVTDVQCVERDLLNQIFTQIGSRVMMPTFGTIIPQLVFEPLDNETIETLQSELENVFKYDPRVRLLHLTLTPDFNTNSVAVVAVLLYVQLNITNTVSLNIQFTP